MSTALNKDDQNIVLAIAGNPNCGKTCIFNALTGARQHVGNWPGVTVEKKEGRLVYQGQILEVVDLPGTYSLGALSEDEKVARDFILQERPDVVINVVNATTLERNLYLTLQILEMGTPMVMSLNMIDEARSRNISIDERKLSELLKIPVIPTVATQNMGIKELIFEAVNVVKGDMKYHGPLVVDYGKEVESEVRRIKNLLEDFPQLTSEYPTRWLALKLLEGDKEIVEEIVALPRGQEVVSVAMDGAQRIEEALGDDASSVITDARYAFIKRIAKRTVKKDPAFLDKPTVSDRIDKVVTNGFLGIPIFMLAMLGIFSFIFALSDPAVSWMEEFFEGLSSIATRALEATGASDLMISFLADGIIGGVGSVLVFIPPMFLLFLAISLLEDSGYMARVAYIMDEIMTSIGLQGESFVPLILGLGCNVPGVAATRTMKEKESKLNTILLIPLMSCSARLPVYALFVEAFFEEHKAVVLLSLYLLSMLLAIIMGKVFSRVFFKGQVSPLVIELPPYRVPTLRNALVNMWERGKEFLQRAGTIIFGAMILMWLLANLPAGVEYGAQDSLIGRLGSAIAPFLKPLGFGKWQAAVALLFGIFAKEIVVGTLGVLYGVGEAGLAASIAAEWTPLSAYSFMVMVLIYFPCVATIAAIRRETNSWGWTTFAAVYPILLGWGVSFIVFNVGRLLGFA